jgi:TonB family protein
MEATMWMRPAVPVTLLLLTAALLSAAPARAQRATGRERALARSWRTIRGDSAAVDRLFDATVRTGGAVLFDAVLAAARDEARPPLVRVHALAALHAYADPEVPDQSSEFLWAAREVGIVCEHAATWAPGDTLRACARGITIVDYARRPDPPPAGLWADSARRDAIVAAARGIARGGRSPVAGAADLLLWKIGLPREPRRPPAPGCPAAPRPLFAPGDTAALDRDRVYSVAEVTQPPTLHNACYVSRQLARNYPPLARDANREGTVVLSVVLDANGDVRDAAVERAGPRPEFGEAALRVVGRMLFTPARRGGARVPVRVSLPIRFAFGSEYPRVERP